VRAQSALLLQNQRMRYFALHGQAFLAVAWGRAWSWLPPLGSASVPFVALPQFGFAVTTDFFIGSDGGSRGTVSFSFGDNS